MTRFHAVASLCALHCLLIAGAAYAQAKPDAGALQQQIERERQGAMPQRVAPVQSVAPRDTAPATGTVVTVQSFRFVGNKLLSAEQLSEALATYLVRPLDFAQLQAAANAVAERYRAAGWVVNAYLPAPVSYTHLTLPTICSV